MESPVISAAEAHLALARGAALASARAVNTLEVSPVKPPWMSRIGALTCILVAAVLTLVVSLSVALGLRLSPGASEQPQVANAVDEPAREASPPSVPQAAPQPPRPAGPPPPPAAAPPPEVPPPVAQTIAVTAPEPVFAPPAAAPVAPPVVLPPVPADVPPAPAPAYVPPPPEPRLRDRIIEHIPIINRFHEPQPQYPR
jgi:hypothetical protein